ncbi:hypothetical protein CNY89_29315, partial [Amaricoccus sp. HAR-UPW-R2A-40]
LVEAATEIFSAQGFVVARNAPFAGGYITQTYGLVLGDRFGAACGSWLVEAATEIFSAQGFVVARNAPFAGGYITQTYG